MISNALLIRTILVAAVGAGATQQCAAQVASNCSPTQLGWFKDRAYSIDQQNSLCGSGFDFIQNAATITFRSALEKRFVSEITSVPIAVPIPGLRQFIPAGVAYCGFTPSDNAMQATALLVSPTAQQPQPLTDQDCNAALADVNSRYPSAGGIAKIQLKWIPWKLQIRLTAGIVRLPDGTTAPLQPFDVTEVPTDSVKLQLPEGVLTYRAALFFSSAVTLVLVPDSAANLSLPPVSSIIPANERIPNGLDLNTIIRLPGKAIDNVAQALGQTAYTYPTGNPTVGNLVLSKFRWTEGGGAPVISANVSSNVGALRASITLGIQKNWLVMKSATLQPVLRDCPGTPIAAAACRAENNVLSGAAPLAARLFVEHYGNTPLRPFSTARVFPLTLGGKNLQFQGLLYRLIPYPNSSDLIMFCQFAIGERP